MVSVGNIRQQLLTYEIFLSKPKDLQQRGVHLLVSLEGPTHVSPSQGFLQARVLVFRCRSKATQSTGLVHPAQLVHCSQ